MSRSGSTITGALFDGFERTTAAKFSFLLGIPAFIAAAVFNLKEHAHKFLGQDLLPFIVSNMVSFIVGYWAIDFLMKYLQKRTMALFIVYRIAMGSLLLVLLSMGVLQP
jgi:undecaprenyl-diphosphatase